MKFFSSKLQGVLIIEPSIHVDYRGFFMESYNKRSFEEQGLAIDFIQDNHSLSTEAGTLRGLHYRIEPLAQSKLVRVLSGSIFDVAVDIRKDSVNYGRWFGVTLSADNRRQLFIPRGFAHGFITLEPQTQVAYKTDNYYSQFHDRGIRFNDPDIGIEWPDLKPILSDKDASSPWLKDA